METWIWRQIMTSQRPHTTKNDHHMSVNEIPTWKFSAYATDPNISFEASFTQTGWPYWHVIFPVLLLIISGFCLFFGWMLFLAESLSSLWKYYFLVRIHCTVYTIHSLLSANCMCSWARTVARKSSIGGLYVCAGGGLRSCKELDIQLWPKSTNL